MPTDEQTAESCSTTITGTGGDNKTDTWNIIKGSTPQVLGGLLTAGIILYVIFK